MSESRRSSDARAGSSRCKACRRRARATLSGQVKVEGSRNKNRIRRVARGWPTEAGLGLGGSDSWWCLVLQFPFRLSEVWEEKGQAVAGVDGNWVRRVRCHERLERAPANREQSGLGVGRGLQLQTGLFVVATIRSALDIIETAH